MRKTLLSLMALSLSLASLAGGLVTNTNQSARFSRMLALDATHTLDAVYYNPAGLTLLPKGFYLSLSNQFISQTKSIVSDYKYLNGTPREYIGKVSAPIFPGLYAAYNLDRFSFSLGINPIGGGGGAVYEDGLPSFESQVAGLPVTLNAALSQFALLFTGLGIPTPTVDAYEADIFFEGKSVYMGYQFNAAYKLHDLISISAGGRYVNAKNTIHGHVKDVKVNINSLIGGGMQSPGNFFRTLALIPQVPAPFKSQLNAVADGLDAQTNVTVQVEQSGSGFTPIFNANIHPVEGLDIAFKYEHKTKLHLINHVIDSLDGNGMYVDGDTVVGDMPAMLAFGAQFKGSSKFLVSAGVHTYFDKNNDYDGSLDTSINLIDKNYLELAFGAQYFASDKLDVSAGFLVANTGVNDEYQSDLNYSLSSYTLGAGLGYKINDKICLNLGVSYTLNADYKKTFETPDPGDLIGGSTLTVNETYGKNTFLIGIGLDFRFEKE
jgi:long-chain fatty acid transport protein